MTEPGYNERLFSGRGLRNYYHQARYHWVRAQIARIVPGPLRIVELGCFDGKLLEYLPNRVEYYLGLDANVENGLDLGKARYGDRKDVTFTESRTPEPLRAYGDGTFNVAVALETLEHIPHDIMLDYLDELARVTRGFLFISVPNEMGPVFLAKFLAKKVRYGGGETYSFNEVVAATLRKTDKVERDEHKGFDYRNMADEVAKRFDLLSVAGIPRLGLPPSLSLTVGMVARSGAAD